MAVKAIPEGYTAITGYLVVPDVDVELKFLSDAFGAKGLFGMPGPDGKTMHAETDIRGAKLMIGRSSEQCPPIPAMLFHYTEDVDAVFAKAIAAGAKSDMKVIDQPWGDRAGSVKSPGGTIWWIASHKYDYTPEQIQENIARAMKEGTGCS